MKVILQETVEGVGHLGDLLDVSDGVMNALLACFLVLYSFDFLPSRLCAVTGG